jgi:hypothetical protein
MSLFRQVEDQHAAANALGILVPPGRRTLVILRPRALEWDLLALRPDTSEAAAPAFQELSQDLAVSLARQVHRALEEAARQGTGSVEAAANPAGGHQVRTRLARLTWVVCRRLPGQPYQPMIFTNPDDADACGRRIASILFPTADDEQELYFNTRNFSR